MTSLQRGSLNQMGLGWYFAEWEGVGPCFQGAYPPRGRNLIRSIGSHIQANNGGWGVTFHQVTHDWSLSAGKIRAMSYALIWPALVALRSGNAPGE